MTNKKRIISSILACVICFIMLFSVCYISTNAVHDCSGDDCTICYQIGNCFSILKTTASAVLVASLILTAAYLIVSELNSEQSYENLITLVSLKVKLSN